MYLKRVGMYGFKSFSQDIQVDLRSGITALVGPNGGGKSNVVDAIRWALGEQRVRELRAERWEDLLYQGGMGRPAARMAEVTLEFDNHDGEMAHWPESLTVSRRYYRSGDSEYIINGQSVRLKDVTDLFLDSGIGRFSYAIISQGRVEEALLQKPLERLDQLQEAAGVSRYKVRKKETLSHLGETEAKLVRLSDLLLEVDRQMAEVQDQAEIESRYLAWEKLRHQWQDRLDYTEFRHAEEKKARLLNQIDGVINERHAIQEERQTVEEQHLALRQSIEQNGTIAEKDLTDLKRLTESETQARVKIGEWETRLDHLRRERKTIDVSQLMIVQQREKLLQERPQAGPQEMERDALKSQKEDLDAEMANAIRARDEALQKLTDLKASYADHQAERQRGAERLARLKGLLRLGGADNEIMIILRQKREEGRRLEQEVRRLTEEVVRLTAERTRIKTFVATLEHETYSLRHQLAGRQARLRALHQLEAEGEGLYAGVRAVLKGQNTGHLNGVIGTLGSLLESDSDVTLAIQTALGGSHQDLIMETEEHARLAVRFLKNGSLGRATFLPLDAVRPARVSPEDHRMLTREAGVVGWAADLVRSARPIRPAILHVLGRVLIVRALEDATRLGHMHHFRYKTVTLDGQVVHAGGAITGGSRVVERSTRTARKIEMDELTHRIEEDRRMVEGKEELLASSRQELDDLDQNLDATREILGDRRNHWLEIRRELADDQEIGDPKELLTALEQVETAVKALDRDISACELLYQERSRVYDQLRQRESAVSERIHRVETELREHQLISERITQELARTQEQENAQRDRVLAMRDEGETLESALTALREQLMAIQSEQQARESQRKAMLEDLADRRDEALSVENRLKVLELADRKMEQRAHLWTQEIAEITVRFEQYQPPGNMTLLNREEEQTARREITRIAHSLQALGPVVPGSLALFEQLQGRKSYLEMESQDVDAARQELAATLKDIDQEMERRVKETAGRVEEAFQESCRQLYGGGDGGFTWLDGSEAGVELWVRPPGKRPSHLGLLSGGEKALGGIAWLFSLLSVRPSPFVVLDEVEASLDEANAGRFSRYVQNARGTAQYVIVTHHRQTMEVADALWGVAGDGQGQSRLVSVVLEQDSEVLLP